MSGFGKYQDEITEVEGLAGKATFPGVKEILEKYRANLVAKKFQEDKAAASSNSDTSSSSPSLSKSATSSSPSSKPAEAKLVVPVVGQYIPITDFAWDQGSYNSSDLSVYIEIPNVGTAKDRVNCNFGKHSIDLTVSDVDGKNYRLINQNLEKDIVPNECKFVVKKDKIVLKLKKAKGEHSYETWNQLSAKKPRDAAAEAAKKKDPQSSLMDMMKDLYEDGDENMKKIIGEAMTKSKNGEKTEDPPSMPSLGGGKMGAGLSGLGKGKGKVGGSAGGGFGNLDDLDDI